MNKTILITGSTDGIGKIAATKLAIDGHAVYIHGRNSEKLKRVISEIKELSNNENINGFVADFSDLDEVKNMSEKINQDLSKIDILINNAGVFNSPTVKNKEDYDMRFVVNYFAPYLLTNKLLPLIKKGDKSRIINLGSAAQSPVSLTALSGEYELFARISYAQSKLALTMWSFYLAKKLNDVSVIAVNPGSLLNTNMVREAFGRHWSSADKGGDILYDLAISDEYEGVTGKYFDNDLGTEKGNFGPAHKDAYDEKAIEKLILKTEELIGGHE